MTLYVAIILTLLITAGLYLLIQYRDKKGAIVRYSRVMDLPRSSPSHRLRLASLPQTLLFTAFGLFLLAWLDPRLPLPAYPAGAGLQKAEPTEGIAIYLLLDQSGSMRQRNPANLAGPTKIEMLKQETHQFIAGRPNDLIGLIAFARAAKVLSPLTLDHERLLKTLGKFTVVNDPDQDGTGIGYALFKTVNLIAATRHFAEQLIAEKKIAYTINNAIIVLVTDGFQSPNPLDKGNALRTMGIEDAAAFAQTNDVKLYFINIEPSFNRDEFVPHRHLLERAAALTGGKLYLSPTPEELKRIFQEIDQLEKSPTPESYLAEEGKQIPNLYPLFSILILGGLSALSAAIILSTTYLRRAP